MSTEGIVITLDHPGLPYRPGDILKGQVQVPPTLRFDSLELRLLGFTVDITLSKQNRYPVTRAYCTILVNRAQALKFNGSNLYRFEMPIPATTEEGPNPFAPHEPIKRGIFAKAPTWSDARKAMAEVKDRRAARSFASQVGHALPPTFPLSVNVDGMIEHYPSIEYRISARALQTSSSSPRAVANASPVPFWVTANCPSVDAIQQMIEGRELSQQSYSFVVKSKHLLTQDEAKKPSSLSRLKMKMDQNVLPTFSFKCTLSAPSYVHIGDSLEFQVDLSPESHVAQKGPVINKVPLVEITSGTLSLERVVSACAATFGLSSRTVAETELAFSAFAPGSSGSTTASQAWTCKIDPMLLNRSVIPDLKTYNIGLLSKIKIKLDVTCAQTHESIHFNAPIKIFSRRRQSTDIGETSGFVEGPQDLNEDWGSAEKPIAGIDSSGIRSSVHTVQLALNAANLALGIAQMALAM